MAKAKPHATKLLGLHGKVSQNGAALVELEELLAKTEERERRVAARRTGAGRDRFPALGAQR